jgi:hypothetical protein
VATVDEDLKAFLQANAPLAAKIGSRIHENYVPMKVGPAGEITMLSQIPYIWFQQSGEVREDALSDTVGTLPIGYEFALVVVAQSIRDARTIGALVVNCLHLLTKATFGSRTIQVVFVEDQNDGYIPQNGAVGRGFHVTAYQVQVYL